MLVWFSHSVMSDSLWPRELQHARFPCPSPSPGACSNSCPLSQWCHQTISSSVVPFSCLQSFKALGSFPMSWLFASGGPNIGASASVFPVNIQGWFPLGWTGLLSLQSKEKNIRGNNWSIRNMIKPLPSHEVLRNTGKEKGKPLLAKAENPSWKHIGCGARNPGDHLSAKQLQAGNGGHLPSNLDITQKPLLCWHCCYVYIFQQ